MIQCTRCGQYQPDDALKCECGFPFHVEPADLEAWFNEVRRMLETSYLAADTPWKQSGYGGMFENWIRFRIPISECLDQPGSFLDIGCANGFLIECLLQWMRARQLAIEFYGLDYSESLVELARKRLPEIADRIFVGNALYWDPPHRFDYVYTMPEFVPKNWVKSYVNRLLKQFVTPGGKLLLMCGYNASNPDPGEWDDKQFRRMGFTIESCRSGFDEKGRERQRVVIVRA